VSGALSLSIVIYVLLKRPRTWALKGFLIYGLLVSIWEFTAYLHRTAPDEGTSRIFFTIMIIASYFSLALYLLTILSVREVRKYFLLTIIPAIGVFAFPFSDAISTFRLFGWSYEIAGNGIGIILAAALYGGYLFATAVTLLMLTKQARSRLLKKKYFILLVSYIAFQAIGFSITNYFINSDPDFPPWGGLLNFLTLLFIGYAVAIKEEKIPLTLHIDARDFSKVYSSFLTVLYNYTAGTSLGEESFKFLDFIQESDIKNQVTLFEKGITFQQSVALDIPQLISKNLSILEQNFRDTEVVDYYLRILNAGFLLLGMQFNDIIKEHEEFLKQSDLIYGIGRGHYLEKITEDRSLDNLNDIDACLKIYKRILLLVSDEIQNSVEMKKRLTMYYATKDLKITDYGEVLTYDVNHLITRVPKEERPVILIESFNSFTSWIYEKILNNPYVDAQKKLEKLHIVLTLNKRKADEVNIYHTFLESLVARIPKTQIHKLYSDYLEELVETKTIELKEAQKRLLESERMAAIGETAAMVGHDLRNPLQVIFNALYLVKNKLDASSTPPNQKEPIDQLINVISEQSQYMNKIVSDLQDYA
jgi:hypothetical protein